MQCKPETRTTNDKREKEQTPIPGSVQGARWLRCSDRDDAAFTARPGHQADRANLHIREQRDAHRTPSRPPCAHQQSSTKTIAFCYLLFFWEWERLTSSIMRASHLSRVGAQHEPMLRPRGRLLRWGFADCVRTRRGRHARLCTARTGHAARWIVARPRRTTSTMRAAPPLRSPPLDT